MLNLAENSIASLDSLPTRMDSLEELDLSGNMLQDIHVSVHILAPDFLGGFKKFKFGSRDVITF